MVHRLGQQRQPGEHGEFLRAHPPTPSPAAGLDLNRDAFVDSLDLNIILGGFGCTSGCSGGTDGNGDVNADDLNAVLGAFGASAP